MHNRNCLKERRKKLRNNLTPPEARLWSLMKRKQINGAKFRRQHSIFNYIVDFYCPSSNLIIEVDGKIHNEPTTALNDEIRDEKLKNAGFKVLRFTNQEIMNEIEYVVAEIKRNL